MKKIYLLLFLMLLPLVASAQKVKIDGIWYELNSESKTAEVKSNSSGKYTGSIVIPMLISYENIQYSVTSIGERAFEDCTGLTSVTIGNSVTSIGDYAFSECEGLTSITIPNSVKSIERGAFFRCYGLTSITIPNSVTSIGDYAFHACEGLTSVTIPNSVTSIKSGAFSSCNSLTSMSVENANMVYDSRNACNAIIETGSNTLLLGCKNTIIPNSVTCIGKSAFIYCSGLTSVTIPNSVTSIENLAFEHCI